MDLECLNFEAYYNSFDGQSVDGESAAGFADEDPSLLSKATYPTHFEEYTAASIAPQDRTGPIGDASHASLSAVGYGAAHTAACGSCGASRAACACASIGRPQRAPGVPFSTGGSVGDRSPGGSPESAEAQLYHRYGHGGGSPPSTRGGGAAYNDVDNHDRGGHSDFGYAGGGGIDHDTRGHTPSGSPSAGDEGYGYLKHHMHGAAGHMPPPHSFSTAAYAYGGHPAGEDPTIATASTAHAGAGRRSTQPQHAFAPDEVRGSAGMGVGAREEDTWFLGADGGDERGSYDGGGAAGVREGVDAVRARAHAEGQSQIDSHVRHPPPAGQLAGGSPPRDGEHQRAWQQDPQAHHRVVRVASPHTEHAAHDPDASCVSHRHGPGGLIDSAEEESLRVTKGGGVQLMRTSIGTHPSAFMGAVAMPPGYHPGAPSVRASTASLHPTDASTGGAMPYTYDAEVHRPQHTAGYRPSGGGGGGVRSVATSPSPNSDVVMHTSTATGEGVGRIHMDGAMLPQGHGGAVGYVPNSGGAATAAAASAAAYDDYDMRLSQTPPPQEPPPTSVHGGAAKTTTPRPPVQFASSASGGDLALENARLTAEVQRLKCAMDDQQERYGNDKALLQEQLGEMRQRAEDAEGNAEAFEKRLQKVKTDHREALDAQREKVRAAEVALEATAAEHREEVARLNAKMERVLDAQIPEKDVNELRMSVTALRDERAGLTADLTKARAAVNDSEKQLAGTKRCLKIAEDAQEKQAKAAAVAATELDRLRGELRAQQEKLHRAEVATSKSQSEYHQLEDHFKSLQLAAQEKDGEVKKHMQQIQTLKQQLVGLETAKGKVEHEVAELKHERKQTATHFMKTQQKLEEVQGMFSDLDRKYKNAQLDVTQLQHALAAAKQEGQQLKQQAQTATKHAAEAQAAIQQQAAGAASPVGYGAAEAAQQGRAGRYTAAVEAHGRVQGGSPPRGVGHPQARGRQPFATVDDAPPHAAVTPQHPPGGGGGGRLGALPGRMGAGGAWEPTNSEIKVLKKVLHKFKDDAVSPDAYPPRGAPPQPQARQHAPPPRYADPMPLQHQQAPPPELGGDNMHDDDGYHPPGASHPYIQQFTPRAMFAASDDGGGDDDDDMLRAMPMPLAERGGGGIVGHVEPDPHVGLTRRQLREMQQADAQGAGPGPTPMRPSAAGGDVPAAGSPARAVAKSSIGGGYGLSGLAGLPPPDRQAGGGRGGHPPQNARGAPSHDDARRGGVTSPRAGGGGAAGAGGGGAPGVPDPMQTQKKIQYLEDVLVSLQHERSLLNDKMAKLQQTKARSIADRRARMETETKLAALEKDINAHKTELRRLQRPPK